MRKVQDFVLEASHVLKELHCPSRLRKGVPLSFLELLVLPNACQVHSLQLLNQKSATLVLLGLTVIEKVCMNQMSAAQGLFKHLWTGMKLHVQLALKAPGLRTGALEKQESA